jgi:hypothetical protein
LIYVSKSKFFIFKIDPVLILVTDSVITGVIDTSDKFIAGGVIDTSEQLSPVKTTPPINLFMQIFRKHLKRGIPVKELRGHIFPIFTFMFL